MKLYEIKKEIDILLDEVDFETGEIPEGVSEALQKLEMDKVEKVGNIALKVKNLNSFSRSIADEIKTLQAKKKAVERNADWLERYLQSNIPEEKIEGVNYSISFRKSESIEVDELIDLEELALKRPELVRIKYEPSKEKAKEIYKSTGTLPEGFKLIKRNNIQIK